MISSCFPALGLAGDFFQTLKCIPYIRRFTKGSGFCHDGQLRAQPFQQASLDETGKNFPLDLESAGLKLFDDGDSRVTAGEKQSAQGVVSDDGRSGLAEYVFCKTCLLYTSPSPRDA